MCGHGRATVSFVMAIGLLCFAGGCGDSTSDKWTEQRLETFPVQGRVLYNGEPVADATVSFSSTGSNLSIGAAGRTDKNGEFTLTTYAPADGAVAGLHRASVTKAVVEGEDPSFFDENSPNYGKTPPPTTMRYLIPQKYSRFETSGLTVSVDAVSRNPITLELAD